MLWGGFALGLAITFLLQTAVLPLLAPDWIDLLLVLALIYGLTVPPVDARLAGWCAGFAQDLGGSNPLGLHALTLGLMVLALTHVRALVNLQLGWVRWLICFAVALPAQWLVATVVVLQIGAATSWWQITLHAALSAGVAALLATLITGLPTMLGRRRPRRYSVARR
jgi:rod shape-determining protein MreD